MNLSNRHKAIIALIIANLIWGAASPIFKWSLTNIPPFSLAFLRFFLAIPLLWPFCSRGLNKIEIVDLPRIVIFTLCAITLNISFFFLGLSLAPSINAPIIASIAPILLLIVGAIFLKEKVEKREILGTILSFTGVMIIILYPILSTGISGEAATLGNLFFLLATIGTVIQAFVGKKLFTKYDPKVITLLSFILSSFTFLPFAAYEFISKPGWFNSLSFPGYFGLAYGVIFSSALAYFLFDWALSKIEASETGIYNYLMSPSAILIAILFFKEPITSPFLIGILFVFMGMILEEKRFIQSVLGKLRQIC